MRRSSQRTECIDAKYELIELFSHPDNERHEVWLARDIRKDVLVVLKILTLTETEAKKDFARVARRAWHAHHYLRENFVEIFEQYKEIESGSRKGQAYMVMEYFHGERLKEYVARKRQKRLSIARTWAIASQIAHAIDVLRENPIDIWGGTRQEIAHRDICPVNVLIREEERSVRVVLIDFPLDQENVETSYSPEGKEIPGKKWIYVSPAEYDAHENKELEEGEEKELKRPDWRCDVYALGNLIYFMLTGEDPPEMPQKLDYMKEKLEELGYATKVWGALRRAIMKAITFDKGLNSAKEVVDILKQAPGILPPG